MGKTIIKDTTSNIKTLLKEIVINSEHDKKAQQLILDIKR